MSRWRLFYHVVWATNGREALITPDRESVVHDELRAAAERQEIIVHAIGSTDDHVHMAVSIPPTTAVTTAIGRIKGASSHALNLQFNGNFGWQKEYSVDSFSERHLDRVVSYVTNQRDHHAAGSLWTRIELAVE